MALSEPILESLSEAEGHIRNALSFAARSERSTTVKQLSSILSNIDGVKSTDDILDQISEYRADNKNSGRWGPLISDEEES